MGLAWNADALPRGQLPTFFKAFSEQTFGGGIADQCVDMLLRYDKLIAMRKHEHIEPETFSIINYREADTILERWQSLLHDAETLYTRISTAMQPSFFQLVLHPIKAATIYVHLQITRARNQLYALQRRTSANHYFDLAISLFKQDFHLSQEYHSLLDGKWNHIMQQPHLGYRDTWHAPSRDMISGLCLVQAGQDSNPLVGNIGVVVEGHEGVRPGLCNEESDRTHPSRRDLVPGITVPVVEPYGPKMFFELYSRSSRVVKWSLRSPVEWLHVEPAEGVMDPKVPEHDVRISVSVEWAKVPEAFDDEVLVVLESDLGDYENVHVPVINRRVTDSFIGHVESDRHVSIPATRFTDAAPGAVINPHLGREESGAVYVSLQDTIDEATCTLRYPFYTFTSAPKATFSFYFALTLDTDPSSALSYNFSLEGRPAESHRLVQSPRKAGELPPDWSASVMDCAWTRRHEADMSETGNHVLTISLRDGNIALEKIVVDLGGVRESYLGPPESYYLKA